MKLRLIFSLVAALTLIPSLAHLEPVQAHAVLLSSQPQHGTSLDRAPVTMELQFNDPVAAEFTPIVVRDQSGIQVDTGDARVDPRSRMLLTVGLKPLADGFYAASYRVTSLDGHPVQGTIAFGVGVPLSAQPPPSKTATAAVLPQVALIHGAVQATAVVLAGLSFFLLLLFWPVVTRSQPVTTLPPLGWLAIALTLTMIFLGLAEVALYAVRASGEAFTIGLLGRALTSTQTGLIWWLRIAAAVGAGQVLSLSDRLATLSLRLLALIPGMGLLWTLSLQSHAMATQQIVPVIADWLHLVAASLWVGGLVGFGFAIWPGSKGAAPPVRKGLTAELVAYFTPVAVASVLILAVTGLYSALLHIGDWEQLFGTNYGRSLLIKLALVAPLLLLGGYNALGKGQGAIRRAVLAELLLLVGIFAAVGFLSSSPPAKVERLAKMGPFEQTVQQEGLSITLRVDPGRVGINQPTITLRRADELPETEATVGLRVRMITHDMGLQILDAKEQMPGVYQGERLTLGMDGEWAVEVVFLTRQGREIRHPFTLTVAPPVMP